LDLGECWCRTCRFSWFGHQSRFVLGRPGRWVGEEITGFSLSLACSGTAAHPFLELVKYMTPDRSVSPGLAGRAEDEHEHDLIVQGY
jgi:hypothetical protein